MADYLLVTPEAYGALIQECQLAVYMYIRTKSAAGEPTTRGELVQQLPGLTTQLLSEIWDRSLSRSPGISVQHDPDGGEWFWSVVTSETLYMNSIVSGRTWVTNNPGKTISEMAAALDIHPSMAVAVAQQLENELRVTRFPLY